LKIIFLFKMLLNIGTGKRCFFLFFFQIFSPIKEC
jgi:hypothetical protein